MMLIRGEYFIDRIKNVEIKNLENIKEDVHFRDTYIRLEGT